MQTVSQAAPFHPFAHDLDNGLQNRRVRRPPAVRPVGFQHTGARVFSPVQGNDDHAGIVQVVHGPGDETLALRNRLDQIEEGPVVLLVSACSAIRPLGKQPKFPGCSPAMVQERGACVKRAAECLQARIHHSVAIIIWHGELSQKAVHSVPAIRQMPVFLDDSIMRFRQFKQGHEASEQIRPGLVEMSFALVVNRQCAYNMILIAYGSADIGLHRKQSDVGVAVRVGRFRHLRKQDFLLLFGDERGICDGTLQRRRLPETGGNVYVIADCVSALRADETLVYGNLSADQLEGALQDRQNVAFLVKSNRSHLASLSMGNEKKIYKCVRDGSLFSLHDQPINMKLCNDCQ